MGLLVGPTGRTSWTDQLDGPAERTSCTDQLDGPVLFILRLGQFAYSKIKVSVCTLSQLPSPTKALLFYLRTTSFISNHAVRSLIARLEILDQRCKNCLLVCVSVCLCVFVLCSVCMCYVFRVLYSVCLCSVFTL